MRKKVMKKKTLVGSRMINGRPIDESHPSPVMTYRLCGEGGEGAYGGEGGEGGKGGGGGVITT